MATKIYSLACPITGRIRYVGKCKNSLEKRLSRHILDAKTGRTDHHAARWIRSLLREGQRPIIEVILELPDDGDWKLAEIETISRLRAEGCDLTNSTGGGEGFHNVSREVAAKRLMAWHAYMAVPENKAKFVESIRVAHQNPELRLVRSKNTKAAWEDAEKAAAFLAGMRAPEELQRKSTASKKMHADPVFAARHKEMASELWNRPERVEEASQRSLTTWADPEITARRLAKQKANCATPEWKADNARARAEVNARPEVSTKRSKRLEREWADPVIGTKRRASMKAAGPISMSPSAIARWQDPAKCEKLLAIRQSPEFSALMTQRAHERATPTYRANQAIGAKAGWEKRRAREAAQKAALQALVTEQDQAAVPEVATEPTIYDQRKEQQRQYLLDLVLPEDKESVE